MYVCMYVCTRNTAKTVHDSAKYFRATLLTIRLRCAVSSFVKIKQRKNYLKIYSRFSEVLFGRI